MSNELPKVKFGCGSLIFVIIVIGLIFYAIDSIKGCSNNPTPLSETDKSEIDSILRANEMDDSIFTIELQKIGGITKISLDDNDKCNCYKGYFYLNKIVVDTVLLKRIAHKLATSLFNSTDDYPTDEINCKYKRMSAVYVYMKEKDYGGYNGDRSNWVSMCTITPSDYSGTPWLNTYQINQYKH